jgi:ABC-2 type transport system ATP-binding protein
MLELVGLQEKADRPVGGFSGGERQRLGVAQAQVNDPDLLILDEPAAALDPIGRADVLRVMESLRARTTIFYSTHILADVQQVSDTVAILNHGALVAQGPVARLLAGSDRPVYTVAIRGDGEAAQARIARLPWVAGVRTTGHNGSTTWDVSVTDAAAAETELLRQVLADQQVTVTEFGRKQYELEEVFMDLVGGDNGGR